MKRKFEFRLKRLENVRELEERIARAKWGEAEAVADPGGAASDADGRGLKLRRHRLDVIGLRRGEEGAAGEDHQRHPVAAAAADEFGAEFHEGQRPWSVPGQLAFPCATQNEINLDEAKTMLGNGLIGVSEGANMPSEQDAIHAYLDAERLPLGAVDRFLFHQANQRMIDAVAAAASLDLAPERVLSNIAEVGNTASASLPILLAEATRTGQLAPGERALLCGFGSGYSIAIGLLEWF